MISERIRNVLRAWDKLSPEAAPTVTQVVNLTFVTDTAAPVAAPAPVAVAAYPQTAVEGVEYLADLLQISQDAVLRGTQVSERTFYGWKANPDAKPRSASLGRLWPTVETLTYLAGSHQNLASWFHATPEAQEAFEAGHLNRLLQLELEWVSANAASLGLRNATSAAVPAPVFGDLGDVLDDSEDEDGDGGEPRAAEPAKAMTSRANKLSRTALPPVQGSVSD